jgi:hypothetical protein
VRGALARVHRQVGGDLVVARARGVQPPRDGPRQFAQAPLDRHVDVFVALEGEQALGELVFDGLQRGEDRVAVPLGDDPTRGEHPHVRPRLGDILRPQPLIEAERGVQAVEVGVLGFAKARHETSSLGTRHEPGPAASRDGPRASYYQAVAWLTALDAIRFF